MSANGTAQNPGQQQMRFATQSQPRVAGQQQATPHPRPQAQDVRARAQAQARARARASEHLGTNAVSREAIEATRARQQRAREDFDQRTRAASRRKRSFVPRLVGILVVIAAIVVALFTVGPFSIKNVAPGDLGLETADNTIVGANETTVAQPVLPTPIIAKSSGVYLHCAVAATDLTEILIHNASYSYAKSMSTKLKEADNEKILKTHTTGRDASAQPTGDNWMTGQFIRTYRAGRAGPKMSAVDCGAKEGSQVYAPVSGKVLLVKKYKLYGEYEDYRIHIQPAGHEDLDVVLIHLTDPSVKAGDMVVAGETPIALVRDVYAYVGNDMQLREYTAKGDNGNHTHIQVNNAKAKNYHGLDDLKPKKKSKKSKSKKKKS